MILNGVQIISERKIASFLLSIVRDAGFYHDDLEVYYDELNGKKRIIIKEQPLPIFPIKVIQGRKNNGSSKRVL